MNTTGDLISGYYDWLRGKTNWREAGDGWTEITTPYLDRHNDYIQIYLKQRGKEWLLTDDGYTLSDLAVCGCEIKTPRRKALLRTTLNGFAVEKEEHAEALLVRARKENFPLRMHSLVQAILAVNDLFYLSRSSVGNFFVEDVALWLDSCEVRWSDAVNFIGQSRYTHRFDFLVPKSKEAPERLLRVMNNPSRDTAESMAFAWVDTRQERKTDSAAYAVLNDQDHTISDKIIDALTSYEITPILWGGRDEYKAQLAA